MSEKTYWGIYRPLHQHPTGASLYPKRVGEMVTIKMSTSNLFLNWPVHKVAADDLVYAKFDGEDVWEEMFRGRFWIFGLDDPADMPNGCAEKLADLCKVIDRKNGEICDYRIIINDRDKTIKELLGVRNSLKRTISKLRGERQSGGILANKARARYDRLTYDYAKAKEAVAQCEERIVRIRSKCHAFIQTLANKKQIIATQKKIISKLRDERERKGPPTHGQWIAPPSGEELQDVLDSFKNQPREYTIVNGDQHGETFTPDMSHEDGTTLTMLHIAGIKRNKKDMSILHTANGSMRRYMLIHPYAYYLGEEMSLPKIS